MIKCSTSLFRNDTFSVVWTLMYLFAPISWSLQVTPLHSSPVMATTYKLHQWRGFVTSSLCIYLQLGLWCSVQFQWFIHNTAVIWTILSDPLRNFSPRFCLLILDGQHQKQQGDWRQGTVSVLHSDACTHSMVSGLIDHTSDEKTEPVLRNCSPWKPCRAGRCLVLTHFILDIKESDIRGIVFSWTYWPGILEKTLLGRDILCSVSHVNMFCCVRI